MAFLKYQASKQLLGLIMNKLGLISHKIHLWSHSTTCNRYSGVDLQQLFISCTHADDYMFGFLVGEQSHKLLCQPGVIDWTKMYKLYGMYTGTGISVYLQVTQLQ